MEEFCGSSLWDNDLTWNTTDPYFTVCFEEVVIPSIPVTFLLLFSWIDIWNIVISKPPQKNTKFLLNYVISIKLLITIALITIYAVHIGRLGVLDSGEVYDAEYLSAGTHLLGYVSHNFRDVIFVLVLFLVGKYSLVSSSGVQFLYWLFSVVGEAVLLRSAIRDGLDTPKFDVIYKTRVLAFPLTLLQFILEWINQDFCTSQKFSSYNKHDDTKPCPSKRATFISRILFLWNDSFAWSGYRRPLTRDDLWDLDLDKQSKSQLPVFYKYWDKARLLASKSKKFGVGEYKRPVSILGPLIKAYGLPFAFASLLKLMADLLTFVQPEIIRLLVSHVSNSDEPVWKGYFYAAIIFCNGLVQAVLFASSNKRFMTIGIKVRAVLSNAVYRKALVVSNSAKKESTAGQIVNLMSVDTQKIVELVPYLPYIFISPVQMCVAIFMLYRTLGPSVFAGLSILLLLIPANSYFAIYVKKYQMAQMKLKDQRVNLLSQILSGIKILKLYAWEIPFMQRIEGMRKQEIKYLRKSALLGTRTTFTLQSAPFLVAIATFSTYVLSDPNNLLNSEKAFVALNLFNILRSPTNMLPMVISALIQAAVSVERLNKYLNSEELDSRAVTHNEDCEDPVVIDNGSFSWDSEIPTLRNINFRAKQGELVAVVGTVGSGKSSFLSAILGEMQKREGAVNTVGNIAYVSQGTWIQNATLKENIIFGDSFNSNKYEYIINACALKPDINTLPDADETEIGEKGINLSGGQKQRLALARAAYKEYDVYLLDDALSAVDAFVGNHIFENLIGPTGILRKSTRIFVTHGINFLPKVDRIVVMKEGRIIESGSFQELLENKGEFADLLVQYLGTVDESDEIDSAVLLDLKKVIGAEVIERRRSSTREDPKQSKLKRLSSTGVAVPKQPLKRPIENLEGGAGLQNKTKLIEAEKVEIGNIKASVFLDYIKSAGIFLSVSALLFNVSANAILAYSNIWLSNWSTEISNQEFSGNKTAESTNTKYLSGYGALGAVQAVCVLLATITLAFATLRATKILHSRSLERVMRAPMFYFDTTPLGRIINRFSRDVDTTDNVIPLSLRGTLNQCINILTNFIVISYTTPLFLAFIVPILIFYVFLQRFYITASRQLRRLDSVSRSPIYTHFGETISGSSIIRAFRLQNSFVQQSEKLIDTNLQAIYPYIISNLWITVRLEVIATFIVLITCILTIQSRDSMSSGSAGLTISYVLQVTNILNMLTRIASDFETNIVSVERLTELQEIPQEADWEIQKTKPSQQWPQKGALVFDNYETRYREGLELVLKGVSCSVQPGEKVGICGRTGAGKSSLTLALFRLIEPASGRILLDEVDISKIGLHDLRKNITIIPQDAVLFSGTLRSNLDPFEQYTDDEVWKCLEMSNLKSYVNDLPEGLLHVVEEEGQNFSFGQKQLICLARALLRKTSVIILDEATSSVDFETDEFIQRAIRKEFSGSTVITIAHRLNTIMDYDRVLVLDKGKILEFDSPANLLLNENSTFSGMAREANVIVKGK